MKENNVTSSFLNDPFLKKHLNPIFLDHIAAYWIALESSEGEDPEQVLKAKYNLLRFAMRRLFQALYLQLTPPSGGSVYFLSCIHGDGIGDYFALLKSAEIFSRKNPAIDVYVVYRHQFPLPNVNLQEYSLAPERVHAFYEPTDYCIIQGVLAGKTFLPFEEDLEGLQRDKKRLVLNRKSANESMEEAFTALIDECDQKISHLSEFKKLKSQAQKLYQDLKKGQALVHIALALNTFDNPELADKSLYFAEAGNFAGIGNYFAHHWFGMGLQPFEEGIFLKKDHGGPRTWKDKRLPELLWSSSKPTSEVLLSYRSANCLYLAYLTRMPLQQLIFIYLIAHLHKEDSRNLDIVIPKILDPVINDLDPRFLAGLGIHKVMHVNLDDAGEEKILFQTEGKESKILRLISVFPLPSSDFKKLMGLGGDFVGCTGDMSLSDCLKADRVPFYELRKHKLETWQAFESLAKYLNLPLVVAYLRALGDFEEGTSAKTTQKIAKNLYDIVIDFAFKVQWKKLMRFINKYYCLEDALVAHVNRHLFVQAFPFLEEMEDELTKAFFERRVSAEEMYDSYALSLLIYKK